MVSHVTRRGMFAQQHRRLRLSWAGAATTPSWCVSTIPMWCGDVQQRVTTLRHEYAEHTHAEHTLPASTEDYLLCWEISVGVDDDAGRYFGDGALPGNMSISCGGPPKLATDWVSSGSDRNSKIYELPSDELLISWARQKLRLQPLPGPPAPPPTPLPNQPQPTYPDTCFGRAGRFHLGIGPF
jgi:hypothetical protein